MVVVVAAAAVVVVVVVAVVVVKVVMAVLMAMMLYSPDWKALLVLVGIALSPSQCTCIQPSTVFCLHCLVLCSLRDDL